MYPDVAFTRRPQCFFLFATGIDILIFKIGVELTLELLYLSVPLHIKVRLPVIASLAVVCFPLCTSACHERGTHQIAPLHESTLCCYEGSASGKNHYLSSLWRSRCVIHRMDLRTWDRSFFPGELVYCSQDFCREIIFFLVATFSLSERRALPCSAAAVIL